MKQSGMPRAWPQVAFHPLSPPFCSMLNIKILISVLTLTPNGTNDCIPFKGLSHALRKFGTNVWIGEKPFQVPAPARKFLEWIFTLQLMSYLKRGISRGEIHTRKEWNMKTRETRTPRLQQRFCMPSQGAPRTDGKCQKLQETREALEPSGRTQSCQLLLPDSESTELRQQTSVI